MSTIEGEEVLTRDKGSGRIHRRVLMAADASQRLAHGRLAAAFAGDPPAPDGVPPTVSALGSLEEGLAWFRDVAQELADVPAQIHSRSGGNGADTDGGPGVLAHDGLGAPPFAAAFIKHVDSKPYAVVSAPRDVRCPGVHPIRDLGEPRCSMCDDVGSWTGTTDVYAFPLRAALSTLSRARSRLKPHPRVIVDALLRERFDTTAAALRLPGAMTPDDRRWLSALRALYDGFSYTAIGPDSRRMAA